MELLRNWIDLKPCGNQKKTRFSKMINKPITCMILKDSSSKQKGDLQILLEDNPSTLSLEFYNMEKFKNLNSSKSQAFCCILRVLNNCVCLHLILTCIHMIRELSLDAKRTITSCNSCNKHYFLASRADKWNLKNCFW